ncbi:hypothetical protein [Cetobacterium ceti]
MDKNAIKVIKFLVSGKAYSDGAIMKNIGLTKEELDEIYMILEKEGYLESYEEFQKHSQLEDKPKSGCGSKGCGNTSSNCCGEKDLDFSKIKVLTMKAIKEFDN